MTLEFVLHGFTHVTQCLTYLRCNASKYYSINSRALCHKRQDMCGVAAMCQLSAVCVIVLATHLVYMETLSSIESMAYPQTSPGITCILHLPGIDDLPLYLSVTIPFVMVPARGEVPTLLLMSLPSDQAKLGAIIGIMPKNPYCPCQSSHLVYIFSMCGELVK